MNNEKNSVKSLYYIFVSDVVENAVEALKPRYECENGRVTVLKGSGRIFEKISSTNKYLVQK